MSAVAKHPKKHNTSLANAIADRLELVKISPWKVGTIKSVDTTAATCVVTIMGDDFLDVHYMETYSPAVNDVVVLLAGGKQLVILGKIGPYVSPGGGGGAVTSVQGRTGAVTISASDLTTGTLPIAQVPALPASQITSGQMSVANGGTGLATVTSGNYLSGNGTGALNSRTPTQVKSDLGLAAVASSGAYSDLSGKPAIKTISATVTSGSVTSTNTSITGTSTSFTTTNANAIVIATAFFDVTNSGTVSSGNRFVGYVGLDGTRQNTNAAVWGSSTANLRGTAGMTIKITVASAGSHTLDLWCSANGSIPTLNGAFFTAVIYDGF